MLDFEKICDVRHLTPSEIGEMIAIQRKDRGWTQETLAEIARLTVRTVQRVESGDPCSTDTKRALAGALDWPDMDAFDKPWPIPNPEKIRHEKARLDAETVEIALLPLAKGIEIRELAETLQGSAFHQVTDLPEDAEKTFAAFQDYFRDYGEADECYSAMQKLEVNHDFQQMVDALSAAGFQLAGGTRRMRIVSPGQEDDKDPLRMTVGHIVIAPASQLPPSIRVPRKTPLSF